MFRLLERYIFRETLKTALATVVVLLSVLTVIRFSQYMRPAAAGELDVQALGQLILLSLIQQINAVVPMSAFLACVMVITRFCRDNEAVVLESCGFGPGQWYRALLMALFPLVFLVAGVSLFVAPWAAGQAYLVREQAEQAASLTLAFPGRFQAISGGDSVFYAEQFSKNGEMSGIFIQTKTNEDPVVIYAKRGQQGRQDAEKGFFLVLYDGYRVQGTPGQSNYTITHFAEHGINYQPNMPALSKTKRSLMSTQELLKSKDRLDNIELQWRFSIPFSVIILALLALPIARTAPRQRSMGLVVGIVIYMLYTNLLGLVHVWLNRGLLPPWLGFSWVHGAFLVLALCLLCWQYGWRWMLWRT